MTTLTSGGNIALPAGTQQVRVIVGWTQGPDLDASALLLTAAGKVRSDADFVFYNQPASTDGSVRHEGTLGTQETLSVDLAELPPGIETIALTASTDNEPIGQVMGLHVSVVDGVSGADIARFDVTRAGPETALVLGELYRRNGAWKFRAVGAGWASGLAGLARDYGISVDEAAAAEPTKSVRLEKQLLGSPPHMIDMVKRAGVVLEKRGLGSHKARVAVCLDISPSMIGLYVSGKVQQLTERLLALAVQFDDDGQCDVFTFGGLGGHTEGPLDLRSVEGYVQQLIEHRGFDAGTNYGAALETIRQHYFPETDGGPRFEPRQPQDSDLPVFVVFITDGDTQEQELAQQQVEWSAFEPIFWSFMAIEVPPNMPTSVATRGATKADRRSIFGRRDVPTAPPAPTMQLAVNYSATHRERIGPESMQSWLWTAGTTTQEFVFLQGLADGPRHLPNASFWSVVDPLAPTEEELYEMLTSRYLHWLDRARTANILP
ncbi:TerD family protein [Antrihabitans stalactiti]|uniref:Stress response protein n=1 Tax=Antrihabitans stalactiti TaxID=2584121 RepID=A0A848KSZ5_9NOCA|nr:stress response protein [Antrihabitans stalactiti]